MNLMFLVDTPARRRAISAYTILLILFVWPALALGTEAGLSSHQDLNRQIGGQAQLLVEQGTLLDTAEIIQRFRHQQAGPLNQGILATAPDHQRYWLLWDSAVDSLRAQPGDLLEVLHPYPMMNRADLIILRDSREIARFHNGNKTPIGDRGIQSRLVAFELPALSAGDQLLLMVDSEATQKLSFRLVSKDIFAQDASRDEVAWGIFFGIIGLSIFYNLLMYFAIGNKAYLHYVLYLSSALLAQAALSSHGLMYLWPNEVEFNYNLTIFFIGISSAFGLLFVRHFLNTGAFSRRLDRFISLLIYISVLLAVASRFVSFDTLSVYSDVLLCVFTMAALIAGSLAWRHGIVEARYFLLAWGSMLLCMVVYILSIRNLLPLNTLTTFSPQIATLLDLSFLSFAIADQIRLTRKQKEESLRQHEQTIGALHQAESNLIRRALYNSLTGLPNKSAFNDCINRALDEDKKVICFIMKIKGMRGINQTIGHHIADEVLREIALRIDQEIAIIGKDKALKILGSDDHYVAALGGIKCGLLLESDSEEDAKTLIKVLTNNLPSTYQAERFSVHLSLCAGLALSQTHGENSEELMRNAHIALEHADKLGKPIVVYSHTINHYSERRLFLIGELQKAIQNDELEIYFQPQLDLRNNTIYSAEALIRWKHPEHGFIAPTEFVPLAEEAGSIKALTRWVIDNTLAHLQAFHQQGFAIGISINLSAKNISESDLTDFILEKLYRYDIQPNLLTLELTETASMQDPAQTLDLFKKWHHVGIEISIDDFGTGYSSLAYLKELPVNEIKIDRAFIKNIDRDEGDLAIVKSIIDISHNMKLRVVGEGIENEASLNRVKGLNCDIVQGYYFSRPVPCDEFLQTLRNHRQEAADKPYVLYEAKKLEDKDGNS